MQPTNALDNYVVAVKKKESQVVGHLLLGKSGQFMEKGVLLFKSQ